MATKILEWAKKLPERTPFTAKELLHLGKRAAVDQALSRLVTTGKLQRATRGFYVLPVRGTFGTKPPSAAKVIQKVAEERGEPLVLHGASAANLLGLSTQQPGGPIYLTRGRSRRFAIANQMIEFRHAPQWQLMLPNTAAGNVIRAFAWLGPEKAAEAVSVVREHIPRQETEALLSLRHHLPTWMAQQVSQLAPNAT
jgi:hypothetical protein